MERYSEHESFEWCGYEWLKQPIWGNNHPDDDLAWFDKESYEIDEDGTLTLLIRHNPKICEVKDRGLIEKPFGVPHLRTKQEFKYGIFEWEMMLPEGKYLWPALWFASDTSWPPEIDCMEGWSKNNPKFISNVFWKRIKPTVHWSKGCDAFTGEHLQKGTNNICGCILKNNAFNKYKVVWTPNYIDVFYNNIRIRRFKNKEMLAHFNRDDIKLHAIMAIGFEKEFPEYFQDYLYRNKPMKIKSFKYTPLS